MHTLISNHYLGNDGRAYQLARQSDTSIADTPLISSTFGLTCIRATLSSTSVVAMAASYATCSAWLQKSRRCRGKSGRTRGSSAIGGCDCIPILRACHRTPDTTWYSRITCWNTFVTCVQHWRRFVRPLDQVERSCLSFHSMTRIVRINANGVRTILITTFSRGRRASWRICCTKLATKFGRASLLRLPGTQNFSLRKNLVSKNSRFGP